MPKAKITIDGLPSPQINPVHFEFIIDVIQFTQSAEYFNDTRHGQYYQVPAVIGERIDDVSGRKTGQVVVINLVRQDQQVKMEYIR